MPEVCHDLRSDLTHARRCPVVEPRSSMPSDFARSCSLISSQPPKLPRWRETTVERSLPLVELLRPRRTDRLPPRALGLANGRPASVSATIAWRSSAVTGSSRPLVDGRGSRSARNRRGDDQQLAAVAAPSPPSPPRARSRARWWTERRRRRVCELPLLNWARSFLCCRRRTDVRASGAKVPAPPGRRHLPGADRSTLQRPSRRPDLLRQRCRSGPRPTPGSASQSAHAPLRHGVERVTGTHVDQRPPRTGLVRRAHLTDDLAFAGDERVEPGRELEEMVARRQWSAPPVSAPARSPDKISTALALRLSASPVLDVQLGPRCTSTGTLPRRDVLRAHATASDRTRPLARFHRGVIVRGA